MYNEIKDYFIKTKQKNDVNKSSARIIIVCRWCIYNHIFKKSKQYCTILIGKYTLCIKTGSAVSLYFDHF